MWCSLDMGTPAAVLCPIGYVASSRGGGEGPPDDKDTKTHHQAHLFNYLLLQAVCCPDAKPPCSPGGVPPLYRGGLLPPLVGGAYHVP
jgi:hypothetical protein